MQFIFIKVPSNYSRTYLACTSECFFSVDSRDRKTNILNDFETVFLSSSVHLKGMKKMNKEEEKIIMVTDKETFFLDLRKPTKKLFCLKNLFLNRKEKYLYGRHLEMDDVNLFYFLK